MLRIESGAHRASSSKLGRASSRARLILGLALAGSVILPLAAAPPAGAMTGSVSSPAAAVALSTTSIDKPWFTTEQYYYALLNCTRTGGWVQTNGTCSGYGSGHYSAYVAPLIYSTNMADRVSRPYAKFIATRAICSHYANGDPGYRLRRGGFYRSWWGENVGCRDNYSNNKTAVLASHLVFQAERSTNGGHWRNMKNANYHWVGIGIWRSGSRLRLVVDFYG